MWEEDGQAVLASSHQLCCPGKLLTIHRCWQAFQLGVQGHILHEYIIYGKPGGNGAVYARCRVHWLRSKCEGGSGKTGVEGDLVDGALEGCKHDSCCKGSLIPVSLGDAAYEREADTRAKCSNHTAKNDSWYESWTPLSSRTYTKELKINLGQ